MHDLLGILQPVSYLNRSQGAVFISGVQSIRDQMIDLYCNQKLVQTLGRDKMEKKQEVQNRRRDFKTVGHRQL